MQFAALHTVQRLIRLGTPLPFNVRDAEGNLLLARGLVVEQRPQLAELIRRGALVDLDELQSPRARALAAPREQLPQLWDDAVARIGATLAQCKAESFGAALEDAVAPALTLVERDPDLAIFQVLSQGASIDTAYGMTRALHAAITACLVAQRLAWEARDVERAFKVALTMNLSMLALQGELARQDVPPTPEQRTQLRTHPMRSVQMLQLAGVRDEDWLRAVLQHHELEDGSGYPSGRSDVCELASLARRADVYTAKLSARKHRYAQAADVAGRAMFMQDPSHPMTQALVKEFGVYPPGSLVRLASGESAIVVQRGESITAPIVACLTDRAGRSLAVPQRVASSSPGRGVVGLLGAAGPQPPKSLLLAALSS